MRERHVALDGLRGIAALCVAIYHPLYYEFGIHIESMGTFTVYLFFALSALTMMMIYGDQMGEPGAVRDFYMARAARILPLLAIVSAALVVLAGFDAAVVERAIATASGLFVIAPGAWSVGNGAWSIGVEIAFYATFPVVAVYARRASIFSLSTLLLGSLAAQQLYLGAIGPDDGARFWSLYTIAPTFIPFFLMGLLVYRLPRRRVSPVAPMVALVCLVFASIVIGGDLFSNPASYIGLTALTGLTLWLAVNAIISSKAATFAGEISYSLYLTHWFAFVAVRELGLSSFAFWLAYVATAIVGAAMCNQWIEGPARDWLREHLNRPAPQREGWSSGHSPPAQAAPLDVRHP